MYNYNVATFIYLIVNKTWILVAFSLSLDLFIVFYWFIK